MSAGEFSRETAEAIWIRDQGCCVDCGRVVVATRRGLPDYEGGWSLQHREARGSGGTKKRGRVPARPWLTLASNGAIMCGDGVTGCHGLAETRERGRAFKLGFAVRVGARRPSEIPMLHAAHGWVRLDDEGGYVKVPAPEGVAA